MDRGFAFVLLCALLTVLTVDFVSPTEGEAAARRVRRATVSPSQRSAATPRTFAAGTGTQRSPYVIRTAAQLSAFAASVNNGEAYAGKYVRLGADIDLKDVVWVPIGFYKEDGGTRPFRGFFDGAGFTIYGMGSGNDSRRPAGALFGALDGAAADNVSLQFVNVTGGVNVGGLVGFMTGSSLKNCRVSGTVTGQAAVGGIAGAALKGFMENCHFSGNVVGESGVGGLAGAVDHVAIRFCKTEGQVEGNVDVGGFVGGILNGIIAESVADRVTVHGERNVGGLAGNMIDGGRIERAAFNGQVIGNSFIGGVVGRMTDGIVTGCTVTGSVKGRAQAGGLAGELAGGEIRGSASAATVDGMANLGGVVGRMSGGMLRNNANSGTVIGGEGVGGLIGNFTGGDPDFSSNRSSGQAREQSKTGALVGIQTP
ncbi:MAG: hypothetical protein FWG71_01325 [Synergistaceae bacterium]|nr:hypothetical protein [Synergistaceae bacterium]